jgi:hypothetical protein
MVKYFYFTDARRWNVTPAIVDPFDHSYENEAVNDLIVSVKFAGEKQKGHFAFQGGMPELRDTTGPVDGVGPRARKGA